MKRWQKLLLWLLALVLLSQIPFAYRRYRLGRLQAAIQQLNASRIATASDGKYLEYKGVSHVHSALGGHSHGTFEEIIAAAKANDLNFVLLTEHTAQLYNTADLTLKGDYGGILFINGNEVNPAGADRLLLFPGLESQGTGGESLESILQHGRADKGLSFVAYPQEFRSWNSTFYDGIEVYNLYTNARRINPLVMFFDGLWSYRSYPDLLFANFYHRPDENLLLWDQQTAARPRRIVALGGNDAHANIGVSLNDANGRPLVGLKLDPYERSFRLLRVHVLMPAGESLNRETLLAAIAQGHCFIAFDLFGDSAGFSFTASTGTATKIQGDEVTLASDLKLTINTPVASRIVLFKDGTAINDESGLNKKEYAVTERGTYRVEVYLPQLPRPGGTAPWIISNPIYVR
jgi:hypothetical protein